MSELQLTNEEQELILTAFFDPFLSESDAFVWENVDNAQDLIDLTPDVIAKVADSTVVELTDDELTLVEKALSNTFVTALDIDEEYEEFMKEQAILAQSLLIKMGRNDDFINRFVVEGMATAC